jgi:general secretion pathway protein A
MYLSFYGLNEPPFELTANPRYLYLPERQREALSTLEYGMMSAKSLTLLIGEAGTGKTTLIRAALQSDLTVTDFVALLARRFELGDEAETTKSVLLERLEAKLLEARSRGQVTALVVDEAQSLSTPLLEEVRLLSNIETPEHKLLSLVLAGQPELADRLEQTELRQVKQRVALRCSLAPFDLEETAGYISSRITTAGGVPRALFSREAIKLIHERSNGIPRTISVICDNALLNGMALGRALVDRALVAEVCRDLSLTQGVVDGAVPAPVGPTWPPISVPPDMEGQQPERGSTEEQQASAHATPVRPWSGFRWRAAASPRPTRI